MTFQRRTFRRRQAPRRRMNRYGPKATRAATLITGKNPLSKVEQMVRSGANITSTVAGLAKTVGTIMSLVNSEQKYYDVGGNSQLANATGFIQPLSIMSQGNGDSQRNGNSVLGSNLSVKIGMEYNGFTGDAFQDVRVVVLCDKEFDGTPLNVIQVFEDSTNVYSPINKDYSDRIVILKTGVYNLNSQMLAVHDNLFIKTPFHLKYDGTGGNNADGKENQLFLVVMSPGGLPPLGYPSFNYYSRFNYYDN